MGVGGVRRSFRHPRGTLLLVTNLLILLLVSLRRTSSFSLENNTTKILSDLIGVCRKGLGLLKDYHPNKLKFKVL